MIDYRSDTLTKPTPQMLEAMQSAKVGDDVFGEDPTVNELEKFTADLFGFEAGLYCPSGTMTNQIAIKCHTQPGDEVICDKLSHVYIYEGGGIAFNSQSQVKALEGDRGRINAHQVKSAINPDDVHKANTSLVCLENTANRGGGSCYNLKTITSIKEVCDEHDLRLHLDGARVFNAIVAGKEEPKDYRRLFDSISICLSKGLGAPVGSVLLGEKSFIKKARRVRKVFGGGMRQAGYIAAAGLYALQHHVERLQQDHERAKEITVALKECDFVGEVLPVETNIIIFEVKGRYTPVALAEKFREEDILIYPISDTQIRMVFHLDISEEMVKQTLTAIRNF